MLTARPLLAAAVAAGALYLAPGAAHAAQSYDNCTGFIDSVPATITTQGTWCLRKDLGTAITSGNAITIATNNVTLDCNDFKIGGLAAGEASNANGIHAKERQNVTIRNCSIRGFRLGVSLDRGSGHLVENNHLDNNLAIGIYFHSYSTDNSAVVRNNRVMDTGGSPGRPNIYGISVSGTLVEDNVVSGLFADSATPDLVGINFIGKGVVRGNLVTRFASNASGHAAGIRVASGGVAERNVVLGQGFPGVGIDAGICRDNTSSGFTEEYDCFTSRDDEDGRSR